MNNKRLAINMIANIISFVVMIGINFLLTPYIVNTVGKEAYGFVGLANNFVSYGQLITLALNSMAGRFITIKIHQNNIAEANKYFTSVMFSNIFLSIIMFIPSILLIVFLDKIINIPNTILIDVKLLWGLIFLNFLISIIMSTFSVATFVKNRLDLSSVRNIEANIIKVLVILILFVFFKPSVWYIGFGSMIVTIFIGCYDIYYKNKLLPEIKVKRKYFSIESIREIIFSGIWNVITKLGQILSDGLDLLISNLFIDPVNMGILAIAKTVPSAVTSLLSTLTSVFSPELTKYYAKNDIDGLTREMIKSMKISGFFTNILLGGLIAFGYIFYSLWVPGENINLIQITSILTAYGIIVSGAMNSLFGVYTITNKLKVNSIVILLNGILNVVIVFILLKTTNLGIFAIAGVSSTTALIRNLTFTPIYSAKCLGISGRTFYPTIFRYLVSSSLIIGVFSLISLFVTKYSWMGLIISSIISAFIGSIINFLFLLNRKERNKVCNFFVIYLQKFRAIKI